MHTRRYFSLFLTAMSCGIALQASAQDASDAYRYSNLSTQGTARSMGFGSALGSIGGDFSTLSVNPAGLGMYHSSELTFTPSLKINSISGDYLGKSTADNNSQFNFNNFGLVLNKTAHGRRALRSKWKSTSLGFGFNRLADFNHTYAYSGTNNTSSASQVYEADANKYNDTSTAGNLGYLGYQSFLLSLPDSVGKVHSVVPFTQGITQLRSVTESGHLNEMTLSFGANYDEKLMLGGTIGIPYINYERDIVYTEALAAGNPGNNYFNSFTYTESLKTTGSGANLKLGAIYKINDYIRVGAAYHTPTYYNLHDDYNQGVTSVINNSSIPTVSNPTNSFDYTLTTPWRGILSATGILGKYGFITADYEYVDYSSMKYHFTDYPLEEYNANQEIKNTFKGASNFRIGGEGRINEHFMFRLGFGYYGNPYKTSTVDATRTDFSAGLGCRFNHFFADIAMVNSMYKNAEQPYNIDYQYIAEPSTAATPTAKLNYSLTNLALTIGMRF
ncbi:MAG: outer membrane protein transport protein [Bacteroidota bacterium]